MTVEQLDKQLPAKAHKAAEAYKKTSKEMATWDLVERYLPLVKSIVARMQIYFPNSISREDLYSIALSGLISVAHTYDPSRSTTFGSYAAFRIRGSLLDELRKIDWMPRNDRADTRRYKHSVDTLEQRLKRPATDAEIRESLHLSTSEHNRLKALSKPMVCIPLDMCTSDDDRDAPSLHEVIYDTTEQNGRELTENKELIQLVKERLSQLPKVPQKILALYYLEGLRLSEIAAVFGVTESRICQIHTSAINQLRSSLIKKLRNP